MGDKPFFFLKLAEKLKMNEYKRAQLEADLKTAGMDMTPEQYTANAIVKALAIGILAIPAFLIIKIIGLFIVFVAVVVYFSESKKVTKMIAEKTVAQMIAEMIRLFCTSPLSSVKASTLDLGRLVDSL